MTSRAELLALADRVEREEPSRELEETIALSVGWKRTPEWPWERPDGEWAALPSWLHSIDAAASLIPPNGDWWELYFERGWKRGPARAQIAMPRKQCQGFSARAASALTAAALRAIAQEMPE